MIEENTFSVRFPEEIPSISKWKVVIVFIILIVLSFVFIKNDYSEGIFIIIILFLFYLVKMKIMSINRVIEQCQKVIDENKELSNKNSEMSYYLILEPEPLLNNRKRTIFVYIVFCLSSMLYLAVKASGDGSLLKSVNGAVWISTLLAGIAFYDLKDKMKFYYSMLLSNDSKLSSYAKLGHVIQAWEAQINKFRVTIIIVLLVYASGFLLFFVSKGAYELLLIVPAMYIIFLSLSIHHTKILSAQSLIILSEYDNSIKSKYKLEFSPKKEDNPGCNLIKTFTSTFKADFEARQKRSKRR